MSLYKNKYRSESARLQTWNYANDGAYFITICTKDREHYFGEIENGNMQLSPIGAIADVLWYEIKNHAKNIELGAFVVMPNHVHGILILTGNDDFVNGTDGSNGSFVGTLHATSLQTNVLQSNEQHTQHEKNEQMSNISPKPNSISTIIRSYKSAVTKHANRLGFSFAWQTRFYDHIIRSEQSFFNISNYIFNNPMNWKEDKFFEEKEK
ncbi:MAG: transposase [Bacteroidetes bacterium]|nr:transposase [Bacteroidota bacterium]